jgi:methylated-DNA-[protein]-cysteine S-methyltransferase
VNYSYLESPIGPLLIAGDGEAIHHIFFPKNGKPAKPEVGWTESTRGAVGHCIRQLREYFGGLRTDFDLPLSPQGTQFQQAVWQALQEIPYGQTISYGELARRIGNHKACRAVGAANGQNRIPIVIPCHRVIGADGTLTGFGGGIPIKQALLDLEKQVLRRAAGAA